MAFGFILFVFNQMNEYYRLKRYVHQIEAAALIALEAAPVRAGAIQGRSTVLDLGE